MIRLLAVDMDGTCVNDRKQISEETLHALRSAAESGITVVPTTGRTPTCLPYQLQKERIFRYIISSNGAVVSDIESGKNLFTAEIPYQSVIRLLRQSEQLKLGISAHINHEFVIQGHLLRTLGKLAFGRDAGNTVYAESIADLLIEKEMNVEEIQLFYFSEEAKARTLELITHFDHLLQSCSENYVELYSPNASKGNALSSLAKYLGIYPQEIASIGDAENDISMLQASGMKFAMGNSIPQLKSLADIVLPTNNENGVAYAINQCILNS